MIYIIKYSSMLKEEYQPQYFILFDISILVSPSWSKIVVYM